MSDTTVPIVTPMVLPLTNEEYLRLLGLTWDANPVYDNQLHTKGNIEADEACRIITRLAQDKRATLSGSDDFPHWALNADDNELERPPEILTWIVRRRRPAIIGGGALSTVREVVPRPRSKAVIAGYEVQISAQSFDNEAQFNLWAKSSYEVEALVSWFENFVTINRDVILSAGTQQIAFLERFVDARLDQFAVRNKMHHRSSVFRIRTEVQYPTRTVLLKHISVTPEVE